MPIFEIQRNIPKCRKVVHNLIHLLELARDESSCESHGSMTKWMKRVHNLPLLDFAGDEMRFVIYNNAAKCRSVIRTIKR